MILRQNAFENIMGKEENAGNQHFLLFPKYFLLFKKNPNFNFWITFILPSANVFNLDWSTILLLDTGLNSILIEHGGHVSTLYKMTTF